MTSMVPLTSTKYQMRKEHENLQIVKYLRQFNLLNANTFLLDDFVDNTSTKLGTSSMLLEHGICKPEHLFLANTGMTKAGVFGSTPESTAIVEFAQKIGINAEEIDAASFLQSKPRMFKVAILDTCGGLDNAIKLASGFVSKNMITNEDCIITLTAEMNRTSHRKCHGSERYLSNSEIVEKKIFKEFRRFLPYVSCRPAILVNQPDPSNKMQFVIIHISPAMYPHQSHMAFNPRDIYPTQIIYRILSTDLTQPIIQRGIVTNIGKPSACTFWGDASLPVSNPFENDDIMLIPPVGAIVIGEDEVHDHEFLGSVIEKKFITGKHEGVIKKVYRIDGEPELYFNIEYDDGDTEDLTEREIQKVLKPKTKVKRAFKAHRGTKPIISTENRLKRAKAYR